MRLLWLMAYLSCDRWVWGCSVVIGVIVIVYSLYLWWMLLCCGCRGVVVVSILLLLSKYLCYSVWWLVFYAVFRLGWACLLGLGLLCGLFIGGLWM